MDRPANQDRVSGVRPRYTRPLAKLEQRGPGPAPFILASFAARKFQDDPASDAKGTNSIADVRLSRQKIASDSFRS